MITNKCNENCPHCMECSNPQGAEMQESTFANAMKFADFIGSNVITLSGGEPTLHPLFYDFCKKINFIYKKLFTICTNGTWFSCEAICERIKIVRRFEYCMGVQVYSNKRFYKDYEAVKAHEQLFRSLGCIFEKTEIVAMKDLGRAKGNEEAQKMNAESRYFQSCLNASLAAKQVQRPKSNTDFPLRAFRANSAILWWTSTGMFTCRSRGSVRLSAMLTRTSSPTSGTTSRHSSRAANATTTSVSCRPRGQT